MPPLKSVTQLLCNTVAGALENTAGLSSVDFVSVPVTTVVPPLSLSKGKQAVCYVSPSERGRELATRFARTRRTVINITYLADESDASWVGLDKHMLAIEAIEDTLTQLKTLTLTPTLNATLLTIRAEGINDELLREHNVFAYTIATEYWSP